jgi:hypothetical protein
MIIRALCFIELQMKFLKDMVTDLLNFVRNKK